ncbi:MAG: PD40 domain-containing protein [Lewinellaceae bacterium]|nr:PD40 domain-containing protein [Phaeodactylibacter sp.]MCB0612219.1 PD40 domain-containing protein [Phaeodactylibacter sp.]MCB9347671.1 PD40 domain-containing protein [Lewinellaceae bacterium]
MRYLFLLLLMLPFLLDAQVEPRPRLRKKTELNSDVELYNLTEINTSALEFSPVFYGNGIVFVSSRRKEGPVDEQIGETFFELFYAELDPNGIPLKPESFSLRINSQLHEGPVSFNRDGDMMYFTRNNLIQGVQKADSKGRVGMKIYQATRGQFDWENVRELSFNSDEYSCMHPSLSPDGNKLYFASNRPGGQGKLDIWVAFNQNGQWSEPVNMGPQINTDGNEAFPFIHESGTLFFASDEHKGYGALDLFMIDVGKPEWGEVINLGEPFNSKSDDLGIILNPDGNIGYFSSDRQGGNGKDDIYMFEAPNGIQGIQFPKLSNIVVTVYDENTGRPLPGASIWIYEKTTSGSVKGDELYDLELLPSQSDGDKMVFRRTRKQEEELGEPKFISNSNGEAYTMLNEAGNYIILSSKPGYTTREVEYSPGENIYKRPVRVGLTPSDCMALSGLVASRPYNKRIPNANVRMINKCTGEEVRTRTNINGTFEYCIELGCEFTVISELAGYKSDTTQVSTVNLRSKRSFAVVLEMTPESTSLLRKPIREGAVIVLQNIHYDFGKSSIRKGEAKDLEDLARLMKAYPSMEIELVSHTDCRGSDEFNLKLSLDRAESAKEFLLSRGIEKKRIKAFGYGEAFPVNQCDCEEGVNCTDEEYEANRRTEVKISRMDEPLGAEYSFPFDEKN